jgi:hypothetical protein
MNKVLSVLVEAIREIECWELKKKIVKTVEEMDKSSAGTIS